MKTAQQAFQATIQKWETSASEEEQNQFLDAIKDAETQIDLHIDQKFYACAVGPYPVAVAERLAIHLEKGYHYGAHCTGQVPLPSGDRGCIVQITWKYKPTDTWVR